MFSTLVSEDVGICGADGRSSGAALTLDPPHRCPILAQSSGTKRWKIANAPEPTCQYAGTIRRVGARCCVKTDVDESGERRPAEALWDACGTSASGLNGTQALIHKLRG